MRLKVTWRQNCSQNCHFLDNGFVLLFFFSSFTCYISNFLISPAPNPSHTSLSCKTHSLSSNCLFCHLVPAPIFCIFTFLFRFVCLIWHIWQNNRCAFAIYRLPSMHNPFAEKKKGRDSANETVSVGILLQLLCVSEWVSKSEREWERVEGCVWVSAVIQHRWDSNANESLSKFAQLCVPKSSC